MTRALGKAVYPHWVPQFAVFWPTPRKRRRDLPVLAFLFDEHGLIGKDVLGLLLLDPTRIVLQHCYPVSRRLMETTTESGNRIDTIVGRPALEKYQSVVFT